MPPQLFVSHSLLAATLALLATSAHAQSFDPNDDAPIHWAFAPTLGTGAYQMGETQLFVVNVPLSYPLLDREEDEIGMRALFPITAGVQNFDLDDILEGNIPDQLSTLTITPGVQAELPLGYNWYLRPTTQVGAGFELEGREQALIYSGGVEALRPSTWGGTDFDLMAGISYHGFTPDSGESEDFTRFSLGLDMNQPLGLNAFHRELSVRPHTLFRWYIDEPDRTLRDLTTTIELGLSVGFNPNISIFGLEVSRIGFGFTVGDSATLTGVRLLLGEPF